MFLQRKRKTKTGESSNSAAEVYRGPAEVISQKCRKESKKGVVVIISKHVQTDSRKSKQSELKDLWENYQDRSFSEENGTPLGASDTRLLGTGFLNGQILLYLLLPT